MKCTFIITSESDRAALDYYTVQMCGDPEGVKVWDPFELPVKYLGEETLPAGTKFTIEVLPPKSDNEVQTVDPGDLYQLWNIVEEFVDELDISCSETIYQTDRVIENAAQLIEKLCDLVGYATENEEEEEEGSSLEVTRVGPVDDDTNDLLDEIQRLTARLETAEKEHSETKQLYVNSINKRVELERKLREKP
jgi:hypothetical protein